MTRDLSKETKHGQEPIPPVIGTVREEFVVAEAEVPISIRDRIAPCLRDLNPTIVATVVPVNAKEVTRRARTRYETNKRRERKRSERRVTTRQIFAKAPGTDFKAV